MTKKKLLFLVHRLPYPPNKGDKIASFNLLRFLALRYTVFLGTFIDDPNDRQHREEVRKYCQDLCAPEINPTIARIASLRGLLSGEALSLPYLRNRELYAWTTQVLREQRPERIVIFSGPMAQYVSGRVPDGATTLFDMVDVDSEKRRSYAERKPWPMSALDRREADRLLERLLGYRVFPDEAGRMNLGLKDTGGGLLLVPQFTLAADTGKGRRPSFAAAAHPADGVKWFEYFVSQAMARHAQVETGRFGADMQVGLVNNGPVTFWLQVRPA